MLDGVPMRTQPMLDGGRIILQKQFARSIVAMQAALEWNRWKRRVAPISSKVGRRNLGGGVGQLALRVRMLMMCAAFVALLRLTKTSALGRPGWRATSPAERSASSMACTRGQFEGFCGGERASARRRPPGAQVIQMSWGMGTEPVGPIPLEASDRGMGADEVKADGDVSEDWESGREKASVWRKWRVVSR